MSGLVGGSTGRADLVKAVHAVVHLLSQQLGAITFANTALSASLLGGSILLRRGTDKHRAKEETNNVKNDELPEEKERGKWHGELNEEGIGVYYYYYAVLLL